MEKIKNMQFKILKTLERIDFSGKFAVEKLLIQAPSGTQAEFFLRTGADFAIIIPLLSKDEVVMVEQPRLALQEVSLEFPAGQVVSAEGISAEGQVIADTELREETGYKAGKMTLLGTFYPSPGWSTQKVHVYVAEDLEEGEAEPEELEFITVKKVKIADLSNLILENKIMSFQTIAAYYLFLAKYAEKLR